MIHGNRVPFYKITGKRNKTIFSLVGAIRLLPHHIVPEYRIALSRMAKRFKVNYVG